MNKYDKEILLRKDRAYASQINMNHFSFTLIMLEVINLIIVRKEIMLFNGSNFKKMYKSTKDIMLRIKENNTIIDKCSIITII